MTETMELQLRTALPGDAGALRELQEDSFMSLAASHYGAEQVAAFRRRCAEEADLLLARTRLWVLASGGALVGCAAWRPDGPRAAEVRSVYVRPGWTRRGLADRLMDRVEAEARRAGARTARLLAMRGSEAFYAARGYLALREGKLDLDGLAFPGVEMAKPLAGAGAP